MKRMMFAVVSLLLAAAPASAVSRYDTQRMSCANIQAALDRDSPAILPFQKSEAVARSVPI